MLSNWSLRGRLFVLIVPPLIVVAAIAGVARYVMAERMSQRLYDNTLLAVALTISRDVVLSEGDMLADQLLDELTNALGDRVYYRISGPDSRFVTGYSDAPEMPDDVGTITALAAIEDVATRCLFDAERAFLSELGGDCDLPAGAHARHTAEGDVEMVGMLSSIDGRRLIREHRVGDDPEGLGRSIARYLIDDAGGLDLLARTQ